MITDGPFTIASGANQSSDGDVSCRGVCSKRLSGMGTSRGSFQFIELLCTQFDMAVMYGRSVAGGLVQCNRIFRYAVIFPTACICHVERSAATDAKQRPGFPTFLTVSLARSVKNDQRWKAWPGPECSSGLRCSFASLRMTA